MIEFDNEPARQRDFEDDLDLELELDSQSDLENQSVQTIVIEPNWAMLRRYAERFELKDILDELDRCGL